MFLRIINFSDKRCTENSKTNVLCSMCHLWDNVEKCGRTRKTTSDIIAQLMRFPCWVPWDIQIRSEYVIHIAFKRQQFLLESAPMLCYAYIVYLCSLSPLYIKVRLYVQVNGSHGFIVTEDRSNILLFLERIHNSQMR